MRENGQTIENYLSLAHFAERDLQFSSFSWKQPFDSSFWLSNTSLYIICIINIAFFLSIHLLVGTLTDFIVIIINSTAMNIGVQVFI